MRTLVIDCATEACSVALFGDDGLIEARHEMLGRGHAERLVPMIAELPRRGQAERIAVSLGPGSFTGIRVGLAAARALALAWQARLVGYPTLALQASLARKETGPVPLTVVNRAGHGEWFVQGFDAKGASLSDARSLPPEQARLEISSEHVAGSEAETFVALRRFGIAHAIWPDARGFADLDPAVITDKVSPMYGRGPDAKVTIAR